MSRMWTIAGREFRGYFNSPVAYIVGCLFLLALGFFFWAPFFLLAVAPLTLCIYMFCPIFGRLEDTSRYYDKDLL